MSQLSVTYLIYMSWHSDVTKWTWTATSMDVNA